MLHKCKKFTETLNNYNFLFKYDLLKLHYVNWKSYSSRTKKYANTLKLTNPYNNIQSSVIIFKNT